MLKGIVLISILVYTGCSSSKSHFVMTEKYLKNSSMKNQLEHFNYQGTDYYIIEEKDKKNLKKEYKTCFESSSGQLVPNVNANRQFVYNGKVYGTTNYPIVDDGSCRRR